LAISLLAFLSFESLIVGWIICNRQVTVTLPVSKPHKCVQVVDDFATGLLAGWRGVSDLAACQKQRDSEKADGRLGA
jgi:hypothetical protein